MPITTTSGVYIYSQETATDFLWSQGFDSQDVETFICLLCGNRLADAESEAENIKDEFNSYECYVDSLTSSCNNVIDLIDETLAKKRIPDARDVLEHVRKILFDIL